MPPPSTRPGRAAGAAYLVVVLTGIFSLAYVPSRLAAHGPGPAVLDGIVANAGLFRAGVASLIVEQVAYLALALLLFRLLHAAGRTAAVAMVACVAMAVPVALAGVVDRLDALWLLTGASADAGIAPAQARTMAAASLQGYRHALAIASLFWGLWLLPLGGLVLRSRVLPRVLGVLLIAGGLGYVADLFLDLLWAGYGALPLGRYITLPAAVGEIGTALWLLVAGARPATAR